MTRKTNVQTTIEIEGQIALDLGITAEQFMEAYRLGNLPEGVVQAVVTALEQRSKLYSEAVRLVVHADGILCTPEVSQSLDNLRKIVDMPTLTDR